jgi:hypothetical protein
MLILSEPPYTAIHHDQRGGSPDSFPRRQGFDRTENGHPSPMIISAGKTMARRAKVQAIRG